MTQSPHAAFGQDFTQPPAPQPPTVQVAASSDPELAQLHMLYAKLKDDADAAAERFNVVKDAIKVKLNERDPEARRFALTGESGPTLTLSYTVSSRFDSRRFRKDEPEIFAAYQTESGSWTLKAV
jgi:hypothetical protein